MQHFVQNNSDRPNIILHRVHVSLQRFGTHVEGRADIDSLLRVRGCPLREPEVGYLNGFVLEQNVGWLEVAM